MSAKVRVALSGALLLTAGIAAAMLSPHPRHERPVKSRVTVVLVDRWEAGLVKPNADGDYPADATTKLVAFLHVLYRAPNDSLAIVTYSRAGGYTQALQCSESTVGANADWPPPDTRDGWTEETCVLRGLERAASYLATMHGDRRIVIASDEYGTSPQQVDAAIARIAGTGIAVSHVATSDLDDLEALRQALR